MVKKSNKFFINSFSFSDQLPSESDFYVAQRVIGTYLEGGYKEIMDCEELMGIHQFILSTQS